MTTVLDMIAGAMQDIQVLAAGESASAEDAAFALVKLNQMAAGLKLETIDFDWRDLLLTDDVPLPPEHVRGLRALLAVEISSGFGREVDPAVAVTAERSRGLLQAAYTDIKPVTLDRAIRSRTSGSGDLKSEFS